jgi:hypothetical protein
MGAEAQSLSKKGGQNWRVIFPREGWKIKGAWAEREVEGFYYPHNPGCHLSKFPPMKTEFSMADAVSSHDPWYPSSGQFNCLP